MRDSKEQLLQIQKGITGINTKPRVVCWMVHDPMNTRGFFMPSVRGRTTRLGRCANDPGGAYLA